MGGERKYPLAVFVAVTFGFSWGLWGLMIASQRGLLPFTVPTHWSGSFGPALGGLAAAAWSGGAPGVKALLARLRLWRAGAGVWAVALLGIVAAYGAALLLWALWTRSSPPMVPFGKWAELFVYLPVILVIGGPLGEEIGWRGFLQPHLQARMAPVAASAVVGLIWTAWHAPLVWLEGSAQKGASLVSFALMVVPLAYVFAWVFNRSGGGLVLPLVLHTTINTFTFLVVPEVLAPLKDDVVSERAFIAVLWIAAALLVLLDRRAFQRKPGAAKGG